MHNDFTVFSRVVPSGKKVVYYYAYDENGKRRGPWSTGQASKTAAKNYCNALNRKGKLLPGLGAMPTFAEFAEGWWEWESCPYLKERGKRFNLTQAYAKRGKMVVVNQLLPYFGKMKMDAITQEEIEKWFDYMVGKGYKNTYTNGIFAIFRIMMNWAAKKKVILSDPTGDVILLKNDRKPLKIITQDEFKALFVKDWQKVWNNDLIACLGNKLAALTGMRAGEVLGLRGECVQESHIQVYKQYDKFGYRDTKTKDKRNIPIPPQVMGELRELMAANGNGYLFSRDGGSKPVPTRYFYDAFLEALEKIGMGKQEIKERGLCFHAWRHFCNTELQKAGLTIQKVQAVTGHKTDRMSEWYSHFDPMDFAEVPKIQEGWLSGEPGDGPDGAGESMRPVELRIVKPEQEPERKMA
jgi:integrase